MADGFSQIHPEFYGLIETGQSNLTAKLVATNKISGACSLDVKALGGPPMDGPR